MHFKKQRIRKRGLLLVLIVTLKKSTDFFIDAGKINVLH